MHRDDSLRAKLLTAEAADALLCVDLGVLVEDGDRTGGANFFAFRAAGAAIPRDAGAAGEHAGENLRNRLVLCAPELHVVLGRKLKIGNDERFQIAVDRQFA